MSTPTPPPEGEQPQQPPAAPPPPPASAPPPPAAPPPPPPPPVGYAAGAPGPVPGSTNQMAIWSLVLGIISVFCCYGGIVTGIIAIVLGMQAKKKIAVTGEGGGGMATAGLILGIVGVVIALIWILFAIIAAATGNNSYYWNYN